LDVNRRGTGMTVATRPLAATAGANTPAFELERVRADFPILARKVHGQRLAFLDSAASAQKPRAVIDAIRHCYEAEYANVHRGVYWLSARATQGYEGARETVARFLNARDPAEIIFTRNATSAINLVAYSLGAGYLKAGDEVVISWLEHHSNIVPWQILRDRLGIVLKVVPINDAGELLIDEYEKLFNERTKFVGVMHVSNALGTINPVKHMIDFAHARGVPVLVDGAQAAPHLPVDVQALDCDFYAFSGHKLCGPTGIGILYGKAAILERMQPFKGGGDMILSVTFEKTTYNTIPHKFEAGTPPIAAAIGLGAAVDYLSTVGMDKIAAHEIDLLNYATEQVNAMPGLRIIGTAEKKAAVLSFAIAGVHPHDVGTLLNQDGIAIRTGHHCAQPVMQRFKVPATSRASFAFYNTIAEVDALVAGIRNVQKVFA
jgi:cysteine desulfurase/selenocysteine lyase